MTMHDQLPPSDESLRVLLRAARPAPPLPPRFQEAVWRRLEHAQATRETGTWAEWLDRVVAWLLHPRLALAGVTAMLLVGLAIGLAQGGGLANEMAKQQYLSAVSPSLTH